MKSLQQNDNSFYVLDRLCCLEEKSKSLRRDEDRLKSFENFKLNKISSNFVSDFLLQLTISWVSEDVWFMFFKPWTLKISSEWRLMIIFTFNEVYLPERASLNWIMKTLLVQQQTIAIYLYIKLNGEHFRVVILEKYFSKAQDMRERLLYKLHVSEKFSFIRSFVVSLRRLLPKKLLSRETVKKVFE